MYTYLRVTSPDGEEWLAAAKGGYAVNARIRYSDGVQMTDFYSKTLQRRFAMIRFVGRVEIMEAKRILDVAPVDIILKKAIELQRTQINSEG